MLGEHVDRDFFDDGGYGEHSTGYTMDAGLGGYTNVERLGQVQWHTRLIEETRGEGEEVL